MRNGLKVSVQVPNDPIGRVRVLNDPVGMLRVRAFSLRVPSDLTVRVRMLNDDPIGRVRVLNDPVGMLRVRASLSLGVDRALACASAPAGRSISEAAK